MCFFLCFFFFFSVGPISHDDGIMGHVKKRGSCMQLLTRLCSRIWYLRSLDVLHGLLSLYGHPSFCTVDSNVRPWAVGAERSTKRKMTWETARNQGFLILLQVVTLVSDIIAMVVTCCDPISHSQLIFRKNGGCGRTFPGACSTAPKRLKTQAVCASRWKPWIAPQRSVDISPSALSGSTPWTSPSQPQHPTSCWWIGMYLLCQICQRCVHHLLASFSGRLML